MKNVKGIAVATDGNLKRIAITYDEIEDETGKIVNSNFKVNRVIVNEAVLEAISILDNYAKTIIEE